MSATINRVQVLGLKVDHLDVALGRLNLVLGPVGAGKSTIDDAIQFAGLGYVPRVGRSEVATSKLMRGDRAEVTVDFAHAEGSHSIFRRLQRDGAKLTGDASASWLPPRTLPTEAGDKARQLFGATEGEAAQNLDVGRLLAAPAGELAAAVEKLLDGAGLDPDAIEASVRKLFGGRVETLRPNTDGILGDLPPAAARIVEAILPLLVDRARRSLPDAAIHFRDQKNAAAADAKQSRAAATEAKARLASIAAPADAAEALAAKREAAADRKREIDTALRAYRGAATARATAAAKVDEARRSWDLAQETLSVRREAAARVPELRARADAAQMPAPPTLPAAVLADTAAIAAETAPLSERLATLIAPDLPPALPLIDDGAALKAFDAPTCEAADQARANVEEAQRAREAHKQAMPPTPGDLFLHEREVEEATRRVEAAKAQPWREVEKIADRIASEFEADGHTLSCTRELRDLAREHGGDLWALQAALARAKEALAQAKILRDAEVEALAAWIEKGRELKAAADNAELAHDRAIAALRASMSGENERRKKLNAEAFAKHRDAVAAVQRDRDAIHEQIAAIVKRHNDAADHANRTARAEYDRAHAAWQAEVAQIEAARKADRAEAERLESQFRLSERIEREQRNVYDTAVAARDAAAAAVAIDEPAAVAESESLAISIADLDRRLTAVREYEALRSELQRMVTKGDDAENARDVYAAAEWAATRVRDEDLRTRAGALEEPMRRFMAAVPDAGEPCVQASKGKVQLGLRYADRFVDAAALSGGQAALFRAGLAYAVLMARRPILRVLHIELAEACDGSLEDQILRACEAVSHEVQVIVTTCVPISAPEEGRGWNVVRLEAAAHA